MESTDIVVVGSGAGGGTISWLLAKSGWNVVLLEQGPDLGALAEVSPAAEDPPEPQGFNGAAHDEYAYMINRPDPKRRLRGAYNTFRTNDTSAATPLPGMGGFTGTTLGGGSLLWGGWTFRALPIDFRLNMHFRALNQLDLLEQQWGYSVPDWPISFAELEPFYNLAEILFAVCGDRQAVHSALIATGWYQEFYQRYEHFRSAGNWDPTFPYVGDPYPLTPVGRFVFDRIQAGGGNPFVLPNALVSPGRAPYSARESLAAFLKQWPGRAQHAMWKLPPEQIWSDRLRDACNLCGYCGEYVCWGSTGPKSGTRVTTIRELRDLKNAEVRTSALTYEILYDAKTQRAKGVRYLDVSNPDKPRKHEIAAKAVIVSCGAIQSTRLLRMSGPPAGLGNAHDQLGRHVTFHLFGMGIKCFLPEEMQGYLHSEFGHTGNVSSYDHYFVRDDRASAPDNLKNRWCKGGTMASASKKNPTLNALELFNKTGKVGGELLSELGRYTRTVEIRFTGDDLPMKNNRVDLDPTFVDEYGLPVARVTRDFGPHEKWMFDLMEPKMKALLEPLVRRGVLKERDVLYSQGQVSLFGDHQFGTCRMGDDPRSSVVDRFCRVHGVPNLLVVDSSFLPTGLGLNPMFTIVSNALRVGTFLADESSKGRDPFHSTPGD